MNSGNLSLVPWPFPPPVFDRLQYANTEGEGLGDLVTCGYVRQTHGGRCPIRNLEALSCTIGPKAGGQSVIKAMSIPSVVHSAKDSSTQNGNYCCRALPPAPCVSNLPGLPPPYHTVSDQILEVETAWEQG